MYPILIKVNILTCFILITSKTVTSEGDVTTTESTLFKTQTPKMRYRPVQVKNRKNGKLNTAVEELQSDVIDSIYLPVVGHDTNLTAIQIEEPLDCPKNEIYKRCGTCKQTCNRIKRSCPRKCFTGCYCPIGWIRMEPKASCVEKALCLEILKKHSDIKAYNFVDKYL